MPEEESLMRARVAELEARNAELRGLLAALLPMHSGSCCDFDADKNVVVTEASCQCSALHMRARRALLGPGWTE
jgi:hypothetical protein